MPSPLVPVYRPPTYETNHAKPVVPFDGPCPSCGQTCRWTSTPADGSVPHCTCETGAAA